MKQILILITGCLVLLTAGASAQEVIITGFPEGKAGSLGTEFFAPYQGDLQAVADTLDTYPLAVAVVLGGADGEKFGTDHDAKNPGIALGRAHMLRRHLIYDFGVDSNRIVIQSTDIHEAGEQYRFASVRVVREIADLEQNLLDRIEALENRPPVEKHFTETQMITDTTEHPGYLGLQLGAGITTTPFGGVPIVTGAISWRRTIYIEAIFGHTFWNNDYTADTLTFDSKKRVAGVQLIWFPNEDLPVGAVGGWFRSEQLADDYHQYVRLSEGPMIGLRVVPLDFLNLTATYNPSKHRSFENLAADSENDQFMLSATVFFELGGAR